ncbi:anti-sigma factor [Bacillus sp. S3]|uniref:anti-sigma factor n=1 Tax=Bacillus sp. S3 TaxID=486398 RepID=UPI00118BF2FB|nr:anti-sigma factor [Bacillus sp. S3]QCJ44355.1 anti-sigma factor [Bacillus sp. S3]
MENKCENLSSYVIDELSEHERAQFEHHLKTCNHCQNEVTTLKESWQMLSFDFEEVDVPTSLKAEVMDFIFQENKEPSEVQAAESAKPHYLEKWKGFFSKQFSPLSAGIMAVLVLGLFGLLWNNLQLRDSITVLENHAATHAQIVRTFDLKGQDTAELAKGNAYLLQEGSGTVLVIELNNMPSTKDDEVYQVWLLKNGNRENAGTLKPDLNGNGLITYRLPKNYSFDGIGITLEPNPNNTQPQGQKVMGTI